MSPVQNAGLYYPNKFGRIMIQSLEEVMGKNGLNAILNLAGLNHYIESYPPDNLDKGFDFAELSAIGVALEEMYGPRGGRGPQSSSDWMFILKLFPLPLPMKAERGKSDIMGPLTIRQKP